MARQKDTGSIGIDATVASLLGVYREEGPDFHMPAPQCRMPDKKIIGRIVASLPALLFPGHHGAGPRSEGFEGRLVRRVSGLRAALIEQSARAFTIEHRCRRPRRIYREKAEAVTAALLRELPQIIRVLRLDAKAALKGDPASHDLHEIIVTYPGLFATMVYRFAHALYRMKVPLIPRAMTEIAHSQTGIDIHPGAQIGEGFFIDHGTGVVIGETADIGKDVTLYQGVTIGALNFPKDEEGNLLRGHDVKRHPTIGDEVIIYANASILGGNTEIGGYTKIGANVRLPESVGREMLVRVDRPNFRIEPRMKLGTLDLPPAQKGQPSQNGRPIIHSEEYYDRLALSRLADDFGTHCGDIDELPWPEQ